MESENLMPLEYETLDYKNNKLSDISLEKLKAMLMIKEEGNIIYICHPKHLFDFIIEDFDTKEIKYVDFNSINIEKMMKYNDYGRYSIVEQICSKSNNQFTYVLKKASHMIKKYQDKGCPQFSFNFAVVEEIDNRFESPQYLVRGIISCNRNGFSLAFNPRVDKNISKESVWQKGLRLGDNL